MLLEFWYWNSTVSHLHDLCCMLLRIDKTSISIWFILPIVFLQLYWSQKRGICPFPFHEKHALASVPASQLMQLDYWPLWRPHRCKLHFRRGRITAWHFLTLFLLWDTVHKTIKSEYLCFKNRREQGLDCTTRVVYKMPPGLSHPCSLNFSVSQFFHLQNEVSTRLCLSTFDPGHLSLASVKCHLTLGDFYFPSFLQPGNEKYDLKWQNIWGQSHLCSDSIANKYVGSI